MATKEVAGCIQDECSCSICLDFFKEPVILDCGHSFCKLCITQYWQDSQCNVSCPQCRQTFANADFRPNRQLANLLVYIKQFHLQELDPGKTTQDCKLHQKPLNLFCDDDQEFLCLVCAKSNTHIGHLVAPVEAATRTYKDEILALLELKKKQREEVLRHFSEARAQRQNIVKLTEEGAQKITLEFKHLCVMMKDLAVDLTEHAAIMKKDLSVRLTDFCGEISAIEKQINGMKKKCEQPASEFLQDIKQTLNRYRADSSHAPENISSELKEKVWDLSVRSLFLQDVLRTCTDSLLSKPKLERATVSLNPSTAHASLVLSNGFKSVTHGPLGFSSDTRSQGLDCVACVLGCETFSSGRHYWEVEIIAHAGNWAVGVAMESVQRKGVYTVSPEEGIWALQPESCCPPWRKGIGRVHVYLDYEAGRVAFFDTNSSDLIATFPPAFFSGQSIVPFFMLRERGSQMNLCS